MTGPALEVRDLTVEYAARDRRAVAVNRVSFDLARNEVTALVGESGCGKSLTALALMRLLPDPPMRIAGGTVRLGDRDLTELPEVEMRRIRGNRIAMIFQEPMTALNPIFTIEDQIAEALIEHTQVPRRQAAARARELLGLVRIPDPARIAGEYPHRLSGGMRQRAMIAMALACDPDVLIADEPTTALDVTVQAQILDLLRAIQAERGTAILLITHDLGVVAETADRVMVMYAGEVVEATDVATLFARPLHPYTIGLMQATPAEAARADGRAAGGRLAEIPGLVPPLGQRQGGCAFAPRCTLAEARCAERQSLRGSGAHRVRCIVATP